MNAMVHPADFGQATTRQLPTNVEAEQALIGAVLVNNAAWHAIGPASPRSTSPRRSINGSGTSPRPSSARGAWRRRSP